MYEQSSQDPLSTEQLILQNITKHTKKTKQNKVHIKTQHNTTQHNTTQHNTTQHNKPLNRTQHNTTQHNTKNVIEQWSSMQTDSNQLKIRN